jgi:hypothetical protein
MPADIAERRRVWLALSDMFLDTDTALSRAWRVSELARSPYSLAELEDILVHEVYPVCGANLRSVAGEWAGFDADWLEQRILALMESRRLWPRWAGWRRWTVRRWPEWQATLQGVRAQR